MKNTLGKIIKEERTRLGLSQRDFAKSCGVNYSTIAKLETGERNTNNIDILMKIAEVIEMDLITLVNLSNPELSTSDMVEDIENGKYDVIRREKIAKILDYYKKDIIDIDTAIDELI